MKILKALCNHRTRATHTSVHSLMSPVSDIVTRITHSIKKSVKMGHLRNQYVIVDYAMLLQVILLATNMMHIHATLSEVLNVNCSRLETIESLSTVNGSFHLDKSIAEMTISHPLLAVEEGYLPGVIYTVEVIVQTSHPEGSLFTISTASGNITSPAGKWLLEDKIRQSGEANCKGAGVVVFTDPNYWSSPTSVIRLEWRAPEDTEDSGCVEFKLFIDGDTAELLQVRTLCPRLGLSEVYLNSWGQFQLQPHIGGCLYYLETTPNHTIKLQIQRSAFLPYSGNCEDWVLIVEGSARGHTFNLCDVNTDNLLLQTDGSRLIMVSNVISYSDISFMVSYHSINEFSRVGCGAEISSVSATISNIILSTQFYFFDNCLTITVPIHQRVQLDITFINISDSDTFFCDRENYLEIIEDPVNPFTSAKLCSPYHNETRGLAFQSSRNSMVLLLHSNHQQTVGFTATYQSIQSCKSTTYTSENGTIQSTNYPGKYLNHQDCTYSIKCLEPNCMVVLKFDSLDIFGGTHLMYEGQSGSKCDRDYVEISDGGNLYQKLCGNWTKEIHKLFFSSERLLKLTFFSDQLGTAHGFQARWQMAPSNQSKCHTGWIEYEDNCLMFSSTFANWAKAQGECGQNNSNLVKINSKEMETFIIKQLHKGNGSSSGYSVWIGANDRLHEGHFFWSDGTPVSTYQSWFPGWQSHGYYSRQPSDDGLSGEDCVELRNQFSTSSKYTNITEEFYWNDRNCDIMNYFICQKSSLEGIFSEPTATRHELISSTDACKTQITLEPWLLSRLLASPHYPDYYQEDINCTVEIEAPNGFTIHVEFIAFDLEFETNCSFDYVSISEANGNSLWRKCGNWTGREKLLTLSSGSNHLKFHFVSDFSVTALGFLVTFTARPDSRQCLFGWTRINDICEKTLDNGLRFRDAVYLCLWQTSQLIASSSLQDRANSSETFDNREYHIRDDANLSDSWTCQKEMTERKTQFIIHVEKPSGSFPPETILSSFRSYPVNVNIRWILSLPETNRILIHITELTLEYQPDCVYDWVAVYDGSQTMLGKYCGNISHLIHHEIRGHQATIELVSDQTINIGRVKIEYQGTHTALCENQDIRGVSHGVVSSLNYPNAYPTDLDCTWTIQANSVRERILVKFSEVDITQQDSLQIRLLDGMILEITNKTIASNHRYLFQEISIHFQSGHSIGLRRGFSADFEQVAGDYEETDHLVVNENGSLYSMNYPLSYPPHYRHVWKLKTTLGFNLVMKIAEVRQPRTQICGDRLHLVDPYDNSSNILLHLCNNTDDYQVWNLTSCMNAATVVLESFDSNESDALMKLDYFIVKDEEFLNKTKSNLDIRLDSCDNETCHNGGICVLHHTGGFRCQCTGIYTGLLCDWRFCDLDNCLNGAHCTNGNQSYSCMCVGSYKGARCEIDPDQCDLDTCSGHGQCLFSESDEGSIVTVSCDCEKGWQGESCSLLSPPSTVAMSEFTKRLVQEPFWIGIIVVFLVLFMTGSVIFACKFCDKHLNKIRRWLTVYTKTENINQEGANGNDNPGYNHSNIEYSRTPSPSVYQFRSSDIPIIKIDADTPSCSTNGHTQILTEVTMEHHSPEDPSSQEQNSDHGPQDMSTGLSNLVADHEKITSVKDKMSLKAYAQMSDRTYDREKKLTRQYSCDIETSDDRNITLIDDTKQIKDIVSKGHTKKDTILPVTQDKQRKNSDQRRREFAQSVLLAKKSYHFPSQSVDKDDFEDSFSRSQSICSCSRASLDFISKSTSVESAQQMYHRHPHTLHYLSQSLDKESIDSTNMLKRHRNRSHRHCHCEQCCSECQNQHKHYSKRRHGSSSSKKESSHRSSSSRQRREHRVRTEDEDVSSRHSHQHSSHHRKAKSEKHKSNSSALHRLSSSKSSPAHSHRDHEHHHHHRHHKHHRHHVESFDMDDMISLRSYYSLANSQRSGYWDSPNHTSSRHVKPHHKHHKHADRHTAHVSVQSDQTDLRQDLLHKTLCLTNSDSRLEKKDRHAKKSHRSSGHRRDKSHKALTEVRHRKQSVCNMTSSSSLQVPLSISMDENISPKSGRSDLSFLTDETSGICMHYHHSDDHEQVSDMHGNHGHYQNCENDDTKIVPQSPLHFTQQQDTPKHPFTDSAYQSKEQSTEHHYSRSNSSTVSPTLSNGLFFLKDTDPNYSSSVQYTPASMRPKNEDSKRVSRQLQLAARKLHNINDQRKHWLGEQDIPDQDNEDVIMEKFTMSKEDSYLNHWLQQNCSVKARRLFPSRMLSMIKDEEHESDSPGKSPKKISKNSSIDETLGGKLLRLSQHHSSEFSLSETSTVDPDGVLLEIIDKDTGGESKGIEKKQIKIREKGENVRKPHHNLDDKRNCETEEKGHNEVVEANASETRYLENEDIEVTDKRNSGVVNQLASEKMLDTDSSALDFKPDRNDQIVHNSQNTPDIMPSSNIELCDENLERSISMSKLNCTNNTENTNDETPYEIRHTLSTESQIISNGKPVMQMESIEMTLQKDMQNHSDKGEERTLDSKHSEDFGDTTMDNGVHTKESISQNGTTLNNMYPHSQFNVQWSFV